MMAMLQRSLLTFPGSSTLLTMDFPHDETLRMSLRRLPLRLSQWLRWKLDGWCQRHGLVSKLLQAVSTFNFIN